MNRLILISSMCLSLLRNSLKNTKMLRMAHGMMILSLLVVSLKFVCLVGYHYILIISKGKYNY